MKPRRLEQNRKSPRLHTTNNIYNILSNDALSGCEFLDTLSVVFLVCLCSHRFGSSMISTEVLVVLSWVDLTWLGFYSRTMSGCCQRVAIGVVSCAVHVHVGM